MPQEASKVADPDTTAAAAAEAVAESSQSKTDESSEAPSQDKSLDDGEEATREKKGKVKQSIKDALKGKGKGKAPAIASTDAPVGQHLNKDHRETLLQGNPALKNELMAQAKGEKDLQAMIRNLSINEMLTGLAPQGKNVKDMGSHKFWKTQPVPSFEELASKEKIVDGPIKEIKIEEVPRVPGAMDPAYEWVTMDLEDEKELEEVYELLTNHYVEDQEAMFRFRYSPSFLNW
jgi:glycylpeptide N-tetradecanoyltransferase